MRGNPWWVLAAVCIPVIMVGVDGSAVAIANPSIGAELGASLSDLQWITNAYLLAMASLLIVGGRLADQIGRRRTFFVGVVGFAATSVCIGLAGTVGGVIALRALQGVFAALMMPCTLAIVRATFPPEKFNTGLGIWGAAQGVSVAAGPLLGGLLVEHGNWRSIFHINAPMAAVALAIGALTIVESHSDERRHFDIAGNIVLCGALFLMVFGLIEAQGWGLLAGRTIGFVVAGLLTLAIFVLIELRASEPLVPMHIFANRSLTIGIVVIAVDLFALFGAVFCMSLYLQKRAGA